jgi:hypothetical protein
MADINAIIKKATAREDTVVIYMAGNLVAQISRLERQLAEASDGTWKPDSMADADPTRPIAEKIATVREKLKASATEFAFRALPGEEWSDLLAAHPGTDEQLFDPKTLPRMLISASCYDPAMTPEQVDALFVVINQAQRNELFDTAYGVNTEGTSIPFSVTASGILAGLTAGS